jgi:hypothetical protein
MATLAVGQSETGRDARFFTISAVIMAAIMVAGFSTQLAAGRSTFASPPLVHAHAIIFFGWVFIYLTQNVLVARDAMTLHRRLGWIGAGWIVPMVVLGFGVTLAMVRRGQAPFFFRPLQFLVFDPLTVLTFAGLTVAAVALRSRTRWHRRLHFCGMATLLGPGLGRLLPGPLLQPYAWEVIFAVSLLFPLIGMAADLRREGRVHPAWGWGFGAMLGCFLLVEGITYSPIGTALYHAVTVGSPGASVPPLAFAPPPDGPLVTGR